MWSALVVVALLALPVGPLSAANKHLSGWNGGGFCSYRGYHEWTNAVWTSGMGYISKGYTFTEKSGTCVELAVRMHYDVWYTSYTYHATFAYQYRQIPGTSFNFHWSDHYAKPASSSWVGFRWY